MAGESVGLHSEFLVGYIKITTQESYNFTSQVYKKIFLDSRLAAFLIHLVVKNKMWSLIANDYLYVNCKS